MPLGINLPCYDLTAMLEEIAARKKSLINFHNHIFFFSALWKNPTAQMSLINLRCIHNICVKNAKNWAITAEESSKIQFHRFLYIFCSLFYIIFYSYFISTVFLIKYFVFVLPKMYLMINYSRYMFLKDYCNQSISIHWVLISLLWSNVLKFSKL